MLFFITNFKYIIKHHSNSCGEDLFLIEIKVFSATQNIKWFLLKHMWIILCTLYAEVSIFVEPHDQVKVLKTNKVWSVPVCNIHSRPKCL
jgi:uncharacterized membrane protein YccF (DUF307 family)